MSYIGNTIDFNEFSQYIVSLFQDLGLELIQDFNVSPNFSRLVKYNYKNHSITCTISRRGVNLHVKGATPILASKSLVFTIDLEKMYDDEIRDIYLAYSKIIIEDLIQVCQSSKHCLKEMVDIYHDLD